jgi:threonine aldolase
VEQTSNMGGGTCWRLEQVEAVTGWARDQGLSTHCDGARLLNAVVATWTSASAFAAPFDSVWIDMSKGLGAPVGAVLAGSTVFIRDAWKWKQRLGGAMRQSGIIAAAGIYALEHNVERLAEDHANAKILAEGLAGMPDIDVDPAKVETNIVIFEVNRDGLNAGQLSHATEERHGVRLCPLGGRRIRAVTHLDISRSDIDAALAAIRDVLGDGALSSGSAFARGSGG